MGTLLIPHHVAGPIVARPAASEDDFWRVRRLLIETHTITPPGFNWEIRRWDGGRFHDADPTWPPVGSEKIRLWETAGGRLVGAAHVDGGSEIALQLHPDYRQIEEEMIGWAEEQLGAPAPDGTQREVILMVFDYDTPRRRILARRGWGDTDHTWVTRRLRFGAKVLPEVEPVAGYALRATRPGDMDDCRGIAALLNAAFNRDFHNAQEFYTFSTRSPSYQDELNLVAEAAGGSFAALVGCTVDQTNRFGIVEPVCTHPDHRRKGLAARLILEGLRRMQRQGVETVGVDTGESPAANQLYEAAGFTEAYFGRFYRKAI